MDKPRIPDTPAELIRLIDEAALRQAEREGEKENPCCAIVREHRYGIFSRGIVALNYCPACGRKL